MHNTHAILNYFGMCHGIHAFLQGCAEGEARKAGLAVSAADFSDKCVESLTMFTSFISNLYSPLMAALKKDDTSDDEFMKYVDEITPWLQWWRTDIKTQATALKNAALPKKRKAADAAIDEEGPK